MKNMNKTNFLNKNNILIFLLTIAVSLVFTVAFWSPVSATICANECSPSGKTEQSGSYRRTCGNYDSYSCLEWSSWDS